MAAAAIPAWVVYAGMAASAAGAIYSGYTAKQTADYNAEIANNEAEYLKQKGKADEEKHLENLKKQMAKGKVATAKSGVSLLSGSAQDVFDENLEEGMYDAIMIRHGSEIASNQASSQASAYKASGRNSLTSGLVKAGTTILTGYGRNSGSGISVGAANARSLVGQGMVP